MNLAAAENENVEEYLSTIDSTTSNYKLTKSVMTNLFALYDLEYKLIDAKVLEIEADKAEVRVVFSTRKIKGPAFNNNKVYAVHHLTKIDDEWKITSSTVSKMEAIK